MPLPDDASLHIPYEVEQVGEKFVAVQKKDDDIIYASPIDWTTRDEAVLHCEDLNYLRMKAVDSMMTTTLWVAIDVASDGPDGVVILERILHGEVAGWRLLNPAADDDHEAWVKHRDMVRSAVDALSQEELPRRRRDVGQAPHPPTRNNARRHGRAECAVVHAASPHAARQPSPGRVSRPHARVDRGGGGRWPRRRR